MGGNLGRDGGVKGRKGADIGGSSLLASIHASGSTFAGAGPSRSIRAAEAVCPVPPSSEISRKSLHLNQI